MMKTEESNKHVKAIKAFNKKYPVGIASEKIQNYPLFSKYAKSYIEKNNLQGKITVEQMVEYLLDFHKSWKKWVRSSRLKRK